MGQLDDTPCNIVGGTINIGNGKFKVDSNGNAIVQGDIKADGKLELYWKGTDEGDPAGYYGALFLDEPIMSGNPMVRFDYPLYCDSGTCYISDINVEEYAYFGNEAYFYGNVYNRSGGVVFVSDRNAKEEIESLDVEKSAEFIYSQNPVSYKFKDGTSNRKHHGFIAQEVKETMEEDWGLYIDQSVNDKEKKDKVGSIGLRYDEYIADIIATCQYQKQQMDEMKKEIEELKNKLEVKDNGNDETDS